MIKYTGFVSYFLIILLIGAVFTAANPDRAQKPEKSVSEPHPADSDVLNIPQSEYEPEQCMPAQVYTPSQKEAIDRQNQDETPIVPSVPERSNPSGKEWKQDGMFVRFDPADEVLELRDVTSKTFDRGNGEYTAVLCSGPIHYRDENGLWQDISTELKFNGATVVSEDNIFETSFPRNNYRSYKITKNKKKIEFSYFKRLRIIDNDANTVFQTDMPEIEGNLEGGDLVFETTDRLMSEKVDLTYTGIQHDLILNSLPEDWKEHGGEAKYLAIDQEMYLPSNCRAIIEESSCFGVGKILRVVNHLDEIMFEIPLPVIREENERKIHHKDGPKGPHDEIKVERTTGDFILTPYFEGYILTTLVPFDWLSDPDRIFPVIIDPIVTCYIFSSPADGTSSGYSEGTSCYCGYDYCGDYVLTTGNDVNLGWMFFSIAAIPDGSTINSIDWTAYCFGLNWPYWELRDMSQRTWDCPTYRSSCTSGTQFLYQEWPSSEPTGWKTYSLYAAAETRMEALLTSDWFGTGIHETDGSDSYYCDWYGFYYSSYRPYLTVDYTGVDCGTTNHGGANWIISSNTNVGGTHINVGTFQVNGGVTATVSPTCKFFSVEANTINIYGTINGNGSGEQGGYGGTGGAWGDGGDGWCNGGYGGTGGTAGSGSGAGSTGSSGGDGGCSDMDCPWHCIDGDDGFTGGGGGGGGGGAGGYGGSGGSGAFGAYGAGYGGSASGGTYGSGGSSGSTYGSTANWAVDWGSGGGGAGAGGGGWSNGGNGGNGGWGGGKVTLKASGDLTMSGNIYTNGTTGGNGGNGAGESTDNSYDCSTDGYNGCCLDFYEMFNASGGAGGGGGGGSGGGISLLAGEIMSVTGVLQARGGTGGLDGYPDPGVGACHDWSQGGAGGGGGRIKIIYNSCLAGSHNIIPSTNISGGSGGTGYVNGNSGSTGTYNLYTLPVTTITTSPAGLDVVVDGLTYTSPAQFCWIPGTAHSIGTTSPQYSGSYRYIWSSWSDGLAMNHNITSGSSSTTITAYFDEQYQLTFQAVTTVGAPMTSSNYATVTLDGTPHNIWDGSPYTTWVSSGSSHLYSYTATSSGSGSSHRWYSSSPPSGTASGPATITGNYVEQWWFDINENGHSSPCAGLEGWYNNGSTVNACVNDSIVTVGSDRYIFSHWDLDASGTRSSYSNNITMNAARTARANWDAEYRATFRANTVTTGTDLSSSNYATVTVDGSPHYIWDGNDYSVWFVEGSSHPYSYSWNSSGSGVDHRWHSLAPPSGSVTSATTITGDYHEQWWFDIDENGHSSPCPSREGWHDHATTVYGCVNDSVIVAGGTRFVFDFWSGDADGTRSSQSNAITMTAPRDAIANWDTQYWLELDYSGCGAAVPTQTGEGWYSSGASAPITTENPVWDGLSRYDFDQWTGAPVVDPFSDATSIVMDASYTATAEYVLAEINVTIQTDGSADSVIVDGTPHLSPRNEIWMPSTGHDISTYAIQTGIPGERFIFDTWADGVSIRSRTVAPVTDTTFTALFNTEYYLTVDNGGHGTVTGEGWYPEGDLASFDVTTPADEDGRERWIFDEWEGVGTGSYDGPFNPAACNMFGPITETATWYHQYKVRVDDGGHGTSTPLPGSFWVFEDSAFTSHITTPDTIDHVYCTGWTGTGSVPAAGSDTIVTWTVTDSGTVTWNWDSQVMLIVESEYPGVVPAGTTYYDPGAHIIATCPGETVTIAPGHRAIRLGWNGTGSVPASGDSGVVEFDITENSTITWNWRTEYLLSITNPDGYDDPVPPVGDYWCVRDTMIVAWVTSPDGDWFCVGYDGTGSVPASSPSSFAWFFMTEPSTLQWNWANYTSVVSLTITSPTDSVWPGTGVFNYYIGSAVVCSTFSDTVFHRWRDDLRYILDGWIGGGDCPAVGDSGHVSFIINSNSTLDWQWTQQNRVDVTSEGGYGSPSPPEGSHWYNNGTTEHFSVSSPEAGFYCVGYEGEGSIPDGILDSFTAVIDTPSSVNWLWSDEISPLVIHSEFGTPWPPAGTTYVITGTAVTCTVNSIVPTTPGNRQVCTGWTATGTDIPPSGTGNTVTWNINGITNVWWNFKHQYSIDVTSGHDAPTPPEGTSWHDSSSTIYAEVSSPDADWYCHGWNGTGSAHSGFGTEFHFDIYEQSTIEWLWTYSTGFICTLIVNSPYGEPVPAGTLVVPEGVYLRCTVNDSVFEDGDWQYCTGWGGSGSVPPSGDSSAVDFVIDENSTLTWMWNGEIRWPVEVFSEGHGSPRPPEGLHWVPDDTVMTFQVTSPDAAYICTGWEGIGSIPDFGLDTIVTATIEENSTIFWLWEEMSDVVTLTVTSDYGDPYPPRGVTYHPIGRHLDCMVEDTIFVMDGIRRLCEGWRGGGSTPTSGDSAHVEFDIETNSILDWQFVTSYHIDLEYSGSPVPPVQTGEGWYVFGETADIFTDSLVHSGGNHYLFDRWEDGPASLPDTFETDMLVDTTYDMTAYYVRTVEVNISKSPVHSAGYIEVDGIRYYGVSEMTFYWELGTTHDVSVGEVDSTDVIRYHFDNWSDGYPRTHTVGPVSTDFNIIAYYNRQILMRFEKDPSDNVYGGFSFDHVEYPGWEAEIWFWEGTSSGLAASDSDYSPSGMDRFLWNRWSDGVDTRIRSITVTEPDTLIAYYDPQHFISVRKVPIQYAGWIQIGDSLSEFCASYIRWIDRYEDVWIEVSPADMGTADTVYFFDHFSDGGANGHYIGPIDEGELIEAFYNAIEVNLQICLDSDSINFDTLTSGEVVVANSSQRIGVLNCGDIASTWGLSIGSEGGTWESGHAPGVDRFVLRAVFDDEPTPPVSFDPVSDYLKTFNTWASDLYFGPGGYAIDVDEEQSLWFQFVSPIPSTIFTTQEISVIVQAKIYLP